MTELLDPRARHLLRSLIAQHIHDGAPVGSRMLAKSSGLDISAATIRNIMADLEDLGLLAAPHTSAGRVPTAQGYRVFVDSLIQVEPMAAIQMNQLRETMNPAAGTQSLLANAGEMLSAMSQFVGVVSVPQRGQFAFRHIDFVALEGNRVLVILVFTDNEVQNRIINTRRFFSSSELEQTAQYLNQQFAGRALRDIRAALVRELRDTKDEMQKVLAAAVELSEHAFESSAEDVLLTGQTRLMAAPEMADVERLRDLFDAFSRKREILGLLERCMKAPGVRVFIGEESGLAPLDACTVITAPYGSQGKVLGVLGVIGPTRMAYERVIPMVQATADLLGQALNPDGPTP